MSVRALDRKLLRDLRRMAGQLAAVSAVVACGVAAMVAMRSNYDSLLRTRDAYYDRRRFADVFVHLRRAPEAVAAELAGVPGVAQVEPRVVASVTLDVPGLAEPATGQLVSLPADPEDGLNGVHLRAGRLPRADRDDEAVASEIFAEKNRLVPGDAIGAVVNGRWRRLRIVGVGLSPEFVYEVGPGQIFPDNRRFGVLWLPREALGTAFDLDGAFNDVSLALAPGADTAEVMGSVDRILTRWGGLGAVSRAEQTSNRFLADELEQHRFTGAILGYLFVGVAAFLLHLVLARLVAAQREQVGVLKAFGYGDATLAVHYLLLALAPVAVGVAGGTLLGDVLGRLLTVVFARYYRFPELVHFLAPRTALECAALALLAGALAAVGALRQVTALPPAEAMRPPVPPGYRRGPLDRAGVRRLGTVSRMVARGLLRRPGRAAVTVTGLALATALLMIGRYFQDATRRMAELEFDLAQRQDAFVVFTDAVPARVRHELERLPGVTLAEPFRALPVRLVHGPYRYRTTLLGLQADAVLRVHVDLAGRITPPAAHGLLLSERLASRLGARVGDSIRVEALEGRRQSALLPVGRIFAEPIGSMAYASTAEIHRLAGEAPTASGAFLAVEPSAEPHLAARLKTMPRVAAVTFQHALRSAFEATLAESMGISTVVLTSFAMVIAMAIVHNGLTIALAERTRELASLRVLGFTAGEVTRMLLSEYLLLTLAGILLGFPLGWALAAGIARYFVTDLFRLPLVLSQETFLRSAAVMAAAFAVTATMAAVRLRRLDLVGALKSRE